MNPTFSLIAAFMGITGALLVAVITHAFNKSRADREYRLKKLEELNTHIIKFTEATLSLYTHYITFAGGIVERNQFHENKKADEQAARSAFASTEGLINILFPELLLKFKEMNDKRHELQIVQAKIFTALTPTFAKDHLSSLHKTYTPFDVSSKLLTQELYILSRDIRSDSLLQWLAKLHP